MKKILCILPLALLLGCATYDSRITTPTGEQFSLPKDSEWSELRYERESVVPGLMTNKTTLVILNGKFKMNPAVIDSKTQHDVQMFNAGKDAALQVIGLIPK